jgi:hypothetical protein
VIVPGDKLAKYMVSPLLKSQSFLSTEDDSGLHEVISQARKITDTKPVHVGVAILHYSKLMMLKFADFLRDYLVEGSYALVYTGESYF